MTTSSTVVTTTTEEKRLSTGISFNELDIALKKVAKEQDEVNVEVTLPSKNRRARSLSRNNTETLPDEVSFVKNLLKIFSEFRRENSKYARKN